MTTRPKSVEYNPIPMNEFEMSIGSNSGSINSVGENNDLELIASDNQNLVDYEINSEDKYKRPKKAQSGSRNDL